jgi:hypothetical protein
MDSWLGIRESFKEPFSFWSKCRMCDNIHPIADFIGIAPTIPFLLVKDVPRIISDSGRSPIIP